MILGLVLLGGNIGFIWSGTYIFYSWDIIEPLAYFVSSLGTLALTAQYLRIKKPYSNWNYRNYLFNKKIGVFYQEKGFDSIVYGQKLHKLRTIEAQIKDHFLMKINDSY